MLSLLLMVTAFAPPQSLSDVVVTTMRDRTEARVAGAPQGALVVLAIGLDPVASPLPGGAVLGFAPLAASPLAVVDARGVAGVRILHPGAPGGFDFLAQCVALDPTVGLGRPGGLRVSPVHRQRVPELGDDAEVMLLFGQSNCEGWAPVATLPHRLAGPQPMLRIWNLTAGEWQAVEAGVNTNMVAGAPFFGPEMGMVPRAAARANPLWIVKAAVSPSSLGPTPGPFNEWGATAGELYPLMLARLDAAVSELRRLGYRPRVRTCCMMQGESDAILPSLAAAYAANLGLLLTTLRADLAARQLVGEGPPAIRVGLVSDRLGAAGFGHVAEVRAAQAAVVETLELASTVETLDLSLAADGVHFDAAGLIELGVRLVADRR